MPRARSLSRYPAEYAQLIVTALERPDGVEMTFGSVGQAGSFRSIFYAFLRAFEKATASERREFAPTLTAKMVGEVFISHEKGSETLYLRNRRMSPTAVIIRETLAKLGAQPVEQVPVVPDADEFLKKVNLPYEV